MRVRMGPPPPACGPRASAARARAHSAIGRPVTSSICLAASSSAAWALSKSPFRYGGLHHLDDLVGVAEERRAADRLDLVERAEHHLPDLLVAPERQRLLHERVLERGEQRRHEAVLPQHRHLALVGAERVVHVGPGRLLVVGVRRDGERRAAEVRGVRTVGHARHQVDAPLAGLVLRRVGADRALVPGAVELARDRAGVVRLDLLVPVRRGQQPGVDDLLDLLERGDAGRAG